MMATATFTKAGAKAVTPAKLDKSVFGIMPKTHDLLKAAYVAHLANGRTSAAKSKTRGEVSGGGRKPWRQKGTGRARFGSSRTPIWRGGGITFGPTGDENYAHKLSVSAKRQAIRQALSLASAENRLIVLEDLVPKTAKTAEVSNLLAKVGARGTILLVVADKTPELLRVTKNLPNVKLIQALYLNVYDLVNADSVVITSGALTSVNAWLAPKVKNVRTKKELGNE